MSTLFAPRAGGVKAPLRTMNWLNRMRMPLHAWSRRRRLVVAVLIAATCFGVGANAWISADLSGAQASRAALAETQRRVADANRALAQLPGLRRHAAASSVGLAPDPWTSADDVRVVSLLAARSGVTLLTLTPGDASGAGMDTVRPIHLTAQTDFLHLIIFLRELPDLPVLVVPEDVTVKRGAGGLVVGATLHVFNGLRPVPMNPTPLVDEDLDADDEEVVFYDPFFPQQQMAGGAEDAAALRLVGLLRDRMRALALLETADGAATVERGQRLGGDTVTGIDTLSITLTNPVGTRTLAFAEAS